jgi:hypothetical protein
VASLGAHTGSDMGGLKVDQKEGGKGKPSRQ